MQASPAPDDLRADAARNRERVLEIARELLETGDETLPMNLIARRAGVGVGTVYRHFPTRQVLLESLAMDSFRQLLEEAKAAAEDTDPAAGLEQLLGSVLRAQLGDAGLAAVLRSSENALDETTALKTEMFAAVSGLLERARGAGAIRPDVDADSLRRLLCGFEVAVRLGPHAPGEVDAYVGILVSGLRPKR